MSFLRPLSLVALLCFFILHSQVDSALGAHGASNSKHPGSTKLRKAKSSTGTPPIASSQKMVIKKSVAQPTPANRNAKRQPIPAKNAAVKPTAPAPAKPVTCTPFTERFTAPVGKSGSQWASLSSRQDTIKMTPGGGVELVLQPPAGPVTTSKDGTTNDKLGDGSTINSTFALLYGKVSFTMQASSVPGTVTAAVLIGTKTDDEIDVEILGGDPTHWQTNVFRSAPGETEPLYGVFGGVQGYSGSGRVDQVHTYVIDWSPARIQWSVDGQVMRTLTPSGTLHGGQQHYPSAPSRIQIGLWDASNPSGTSEWAKGPIPWAKVGKTPISAKLQSITVECPYN